MVHADLGDKRSEMSIRHMGEAVKILRVNNLNGKAASLGDIKRDVDDNVSIREMGI